MKIIPVTLLIVSIQLNSFAQTTQQSPCFDASNYQINSESTYAELVIKINNEWTTYPIINDVLGKFEYECQELTINGTELKVLVIRWSNAHYGSGGGTTTKGIQIWNLKNGALLLNEIVECSEENFGRRGETYYFIECQKQIEISGQTIKIHEKSCHSEGTGKEAVLDSTLNCTLTTLETGTYFFVNDALKKK